MIKKKEKERNWVNKRSHLKISIHYGSAFNVSKNTVLFSHKIVLMIGEQFQSAETFSLSALQGQTLVTSVHQGKSLGKKPQLAKRDKEACFVFFVFLYCHL